MVTLDPRGEMVPASKPELDPLKEIIRKIKAELFGKPKRPLRKATSSPDMMPTEEDRGYELWEDLFKSMSENIGFVIPAKKKEDENQKKPSGGFVEMHPHKPFEKKIKRRSKSMDASMRYFPRSTDDVPVVSHRSKKMSLATTWTTVMEESSGNK